MPANRPNPALQLQRERRAWALRCQGKTLLTIAQALKISTSGAHKILARVEERESRRLSEAVHRFKARQTGQLDFVIEEALGAWTKSKTPRNRVARKSSSASFVPPKGKDGTPGIKPEDSVETREVVERDGDCSYLYAAMNAMDRQRSLWGLDVAAAQQESTTSVSELVADLLKTGEAYERRKAQEAEAGRPAEPEGAAPGGAGEVPDGPEPIQRDDPVPG